MPQTHDWLRLPNGAPIAILVRTIDVHGVVDSRVHVVHVVEGHVGPPNWYGKVPAAMVKDHLAEQRAQAKKRLHEQLARVVGPAHQTGVEIHVVEGSADEEILKAVDKLKIDLVVMGTAAQTGLSRMMLGNTAERLISHLRCSLIAVKPPGFQATTVREQSADITTGP